jgi:hypothetical protein
VICADAKRAEMIAAARAVTIEVMMAWRMPYETTRT